MAALAELEVALAGLSRAVRRLHQALEQGTDPSPVDRLLASVADYYNVTVDDLLSPSRRRQVMRPRQVAMYLLHDHLGLSHATIGLLLGRDHSTITHGVVKVRAEEDTDKLADLLL